MSTTALRRCWVCCRLFSMSYTVSKATFARCMTSCGVSPVDDCWMISDGFSPPPVILLAASSMRVRSYVKSIAIEDVPVETMPKRSPSWMSSFAMSRNRRRTRWVSRNSRWRSSMTKMMMRPAASLTGPRRRQDDALAHRRHSRSLRLVHATAVHERKRGELLLDAVLVDLEVLLRKVGLELPSPVPDDDVGADEIDGGPEGRARHVGRGRRGWRWRAGAAGSSAAVRAACRRRLGPLPESPRQARAANVLVVMMVCQYSKLSRASYSPSLDELSGSSAFGAAPPFATLPDVAARRDATAAGDADRARRADRESSARTPRSPAALLRR